MHDPADHDLLRELENFTPGLTMDPLPASEVRRRGTRLRRRNTALATVGGVAAVAIIAAPVIALTGHPRSTAPEPAPSPSPSWVQTIPSDFPLTDGMPVPVETRAGYKPRITDICDRAGWDPEGTADTRQVVYTDRSEGGQDRTLALYPTDREAELTLLSLRAGLRACELETAGRDRRAEIVDSAQGSDGSDSVAYANHYTDGGDTDVIRLLRVGNAIVQDTAYTTGGGDPTIVQGVLATINSQSVDTTAAMCVFAREGCGGDTATDDGTGTPAIPDEFPLAGGYPSDGTTGPDRSLAPITLEECGASVPVPAHTGLLRSGYHAAGDDRERQLVTFDDAEQAQSYLDSVIQLYTDCAETTVDGRTQLVQAITSVSGYDAAGGAHVRWERDGEPVRGVETVAVVRVGSAVLLSTIATDEGVGRDGGAIQEQTQTAFDSIDGVVDAMADLG